MAGIKVTPNEFADIVIAFLLDSVSKPDEVLPDNMEFHYIINKIKMAGIKSQLLSYYIDTKSLTKGKYKIVRKSLTGDGGPNTIVITKSPDIDISYDKKTTIRNIVKQTLRLIKSHKMRNNGMPLNEEIVDKIIDKTMENYDG